MPLRVATPADASAIGEVHVLAWQVAYRGIMPDEYLDGLQRAERATMWSRYLDDPPPGTALLVWEENGELAGFASVGPARGTTEAPRPGELHAINLHPDRWRQGFGSALLKEATNRLREFGHSVALLWVVRENDRARRFYERYGWTPDGGEKSDDFRGATVTEVRYRRFLAE